MTGLWRRVPVELASVAAATAAGGAATYRWWRPWCLQWGATATEVEADLPGDDLLASPDLVSTRAVTIATAPSSVWPWLVQMGPGRAGAYTYDWLENLFGLNMHSAATIVPELQHIAVGDGWKLGRRGPVLRVAEVQPRHALVLRSDDGNWVWSLVLEDGGGATRLISRNLITAPPASPVARSFSRYVMEPGSLLMERKMLLGIKARAESALAVAGAPGGDGTEPAGAGAAMH